MQQVSDQAKPELRKDKADYVKQLKAQLESWREEVDALMERMDHSLAENREQAGHEIDDLMLKYQEAGEKLLVLQQVNEQIWNDLKAGVDQAWEDLQRALDEASSRFE